MANERTRLAFLEKLGPILAGVGAVIVLIQTVWITYGVVMRYVFNRPDQVVTEATALLLVPCAFLGLAYALQKDALPKVTMIVELFPARVKAVLEVINQIIMLLVGSFFSYAAVEAFFRANTTGAASEVLGWPRAWFWAPTALALCAACIVIALKVQATFSNQSTSTEEGQ